MTSLRTLVSSLVGAGLILMIGLLLWKLSLAVAAPFVVFAVALAAWSIGAYHRKKWAWRAAVCFSYAMAVLLVVPIFVFSSSLLIDGVVGTNSLDYGTVAMVVLVAVCGLAAVVGIVLSFRRTLWLLYEERPQFFSEMPSNSAVEGDAQKGGARPSP